LIVRGIVAVPGHRDVVDEIAVAGTLGGKRAGVAEGWIEVIFVAGVIHDPEN